MPLKIFWKGPVDFGEKKTAKTVKAALDKTAKKAEKLLLQPTQTWDHKASFETKNKGESVTVLTDDPVYNYLEDGTRPHQINGSPALAFPNTFSAKTTVGSLNSAPGTSGGSTVYASTISHPGVTARNFTEQVIKQIEPEFVKDIQNALDDAIG